MDQLLWVRSVDIFAIYPKTLNELLDAEEKKLRESPPTRLIQLPSDFEWKQKSYFRLLEIQKKINAAIDRGEPSEDKKPKKPQWDPKFAFENLIQISSSNDVTSTTTQSTPKKFINGSEITIKRQKCVPDDIVGLLTNEDLNLWNLDDIAKAGKLLHKPPITCEFMDEQEMRRVYSLIYDVFRYKIVLSQSLNDITFYAIYPELLTDTNRVWLLLFDLNLRHFMRRDPEETIRKNILFEEAKLIYIESCLWEQRVKLAASISRLRIRNSALQLSQLLPIHLQDEKVAIATANPIVSGWMNPFKKRTNTAAKKSLESIGFYETKEDDDDDVTQPLEINHFKWDKICPQFLTCIPLNRAIFAQTDIIKNNEFILQNRTFALGPGMFSRLLDYFELDGSVIQTHVSSPKSIAYLASLFLSNNRVENFIVFGAGSRVSEYEEYMKTLRVNNVCIRAENFRDLPINSNLFERVVGIFATPPNSYSGVSDPIDLICSRGGDLGMLEVLTESEISHDAKQRVAEVLMEQRETIRLAMSRPQIQFILYETHSVVDAENEKMVTSAINSINRAATEKRILLEKERLRLEALAAQDQYTTPFQPTATPRKKTTTETIKSKSDFPSDSETEIELDEQGQPKRKTDDDTDGGDEFEIDVPQTDLFEIGELPDICLNQDKCLDYREHGCYFALLKRKEVTCLDAKYMIKIAEARGVFGNSNTKKTKIKTAKKVEKKIETTEEKANQKRLKRKRSDMTNVINRLSQPTQSFLTHTYSQRRSSAEHKMLILDPNRCACSRHTSHHEDITRPSLTARKWWNETAKYMKNLREEEGRYKTNLGGLDLSHIFEDVKNQKIQPLQLTRRYQQQQSERTKSQITDRVPYPLSVSCLEFKNFQKCAMFNQITMVKQRPHTTTHEKIERTQYWSTQSYT